MAPPDAQASASSVFCCFVSPATVTSSADRLGTIDLPFRRASVGVFSMVEPLSPMALPDGQASESSGFRLFCLTSHSHFKRRSIGDNRSTILTRKRRSLLHGRAIVPNGSTRRASVGVFGFRLFCLTSHSHFKRRSIRDNRSTNTDQIRSGRCPWLSPSFSRSTSIRSSNDSHKLLIGVSFGNTMCLPVLSVPEPPPATRMGKSS